MSSIFKTISFNSSFSFWLIKLLFEKISIFSFIGIESSTAILNNLVFSSLLFNNLFTKISLSLIFFESKYLLISSFSFFLLGESKKVDLYSWIYFLISSKLIYIFSRFLWLLIHIFSISILFNPLLNFSFNCSILLLLNSEFRFSKIEIIFFSSKLFISEKSCLPLIILFLLSYLIFSTTLVNLSINPLSSL